MNIVGISNQTLKQNNNFKAKNNKPIYSADRYINDLNKMEEKRINGDFFAKNMGSLTAIYTGTGLILTGEAILGAIIFKNRKNIKWKLKNQNKLFMSLLGVIASGIATIAAIQAWQNKLINKPSDKPKEFLDKYGKDTNAKLIDKYMRSNLIGAAYNPINGTIDIDKNYLHDPIGKKELEKFMKHELQHARQFEMITGLDNGLAKLNYAILSSNVSLLKMFPTAKAEIKCILNDINENPEKYKDKKIKISGADVDMIKYVTAIDILLNNEKATENDIPMIIDVEHYNEAIKKHGPLTDKEKIKAEEYYQAFLKYPTIPGLNIINPNYWNNILEKEARKAGKSKDGHVH